MSSQSRARSSRRSGGVSSSDELRPTIYVDACLGGVAVAAVFREAGYSVVTKEEQFGLRRISDEEWIRFADDAGMVAVTKDAAIRRRSLERQTLALSDLRVLVLTKGRLSSEEQAGIFRSALPAIENLWRRQRPWIYAVTRSGVRRLHVQLPR